VLIVVIAVSRIKEIIVDLRRYRKIHGVNRAPTQVLGAAGATSRWNEVKVGTIVNVRGGETFPAELVPLVSSSGDGLAFVETEQLDGESNLKVKVVPQ
jgi:phospholipid-transporting ATPase